MSTYLNVMGRPNTPSSCCDARSVSSFPSLPPNLDAVPEELLDCDFRHEESRWNAFCASIGIVPPEVHLNASARRLASKLRLKHSTPIRQVTESMSYLLNLITQDQLAISAKASPFLHTDAMPQSLLGEEQQAKTLDVRPTHVYGHGWRLFPEETRQALSGVISDGAGGLFSVEKLAESCPGLYWSFFCVNTSSKSLQKARRISTVAGAIFSNALDIFTGAIKSSYGPGMDPQSLAILNSASNSFSLSIHGKLGCLDVHGVNENGEPTSVALAVYQLDDEIELETLMGRIQTIMTWAVSVRLPLILDLTDALAQQKQMEAELRRQVSESRHHDQKHVQVQSQPVPQSTPHPSRQASAPAPAQTSRRSTLKSVFRDSLPHWSKAKA